MNFKLRLEWKQVGVGPYFRVGDRKSRRKFQERDDQNSLECDYLASPFWSVFDFVSDAMPFIVY